MARFRKQENSYRASFPQDAEDAPLPYQTYPQRAPYAPDPLYPDEPSYDAQGAREYPYYTAPAGQDAYDGQPDPFTAMEYGDSAPYPDAAYEQPRQNAQEYYRAGDYGAPPRSRGAGNGGHRTESGSHRTEIDGYRTEGDGKRRGHAWTIMAVVSGVLLALFILLISNAYNAYAPFRVKAESGKGDTFIAGVIVDGVDIGGMTYQEAEQALAQSDVHTSQTLQMTIRVDNSLFSLTDSDVPFARNTQAVLAKAYSLGRQSTTVTLGTSVTPMEWRYQYRQYIAQQKAYLYTQITYDKADVHTFVNALAASVYVEARDAMVATFDFTSRSFTFTDEVTGKNLDTASLYDAIIAQLEKGTYNAVIQTATTSVMPAVTRVELKNTFTKISSYTTTTTADFNRNTNVNLAAYAVNGTVLNAGETFSFNSVTGQRTTAKGYLEAAAVAGGTTTDEVGGGVCQVSSTLFNAAMTADLTLVSRSPHTWPSTYVEPGRDATVNWPNLDFKFKNQRDTPIFIVCYYTQGKTMAAKGTLTVEIYGVTLGTGETVELVTKLISTETPPSEPIYERNTSLEPGTEQVLKKARTGYVYETYRVYKRSGAEYKRELLCTSTYKMIQEVIEYN